jgi:N-sulfoglucosamine sulfohydrolase
MMKKQVKLTGKSMIPILESEPSSGWDKVYASHNLHEVTMYYPMRVIRTREYKLIQNLGYKMPFPIDQDFYISPTFQDILQRTKKHESLPWYKTLKNYYYRDKWELFDILADPKELINLAKSARHSNVLHSLKTQLNHWQNVTADPWICSPDGVLQVKGNYKYNPQCMPLYNGLDQGNFHEDPNQENFQDIYGIETL